MRPTTTTRPTGNNAREDLGADVRMTSVCMKSACIKSACNAPQIDDLASWRDGALSLAAIVAFCGAAIFVWGISVSPSSSDPHSSAPTATRIVVHPHRVDIDHADVGELALLPEVGPGLAARIVADRAVRGPFGSVDGLSRVEGIGPARLEAIRPKAFAGTAGERVGARGMEPFDG